MYQFVPSENSGWDETLLSLWLGLVIGGGLVGIPVLLLTFAVSRLRRLPTLINLLITFVLISVIFTLLFYSERDRKPAPRWGICIIQASMIGAIPPTGSFSALALVYDGWISVNGAETERGQKYRHATLLVLLPWLTFIASTVPGLVVGLTSPNTLGRHHLFYCTIHNTTLTAVLGGIAVVNLLATVYFGARIAHTLRRTWMTYRETHVHITPISRKRMQSPYVVLRIVIFSLYVLLSLVLMIACIAQRRSDWLDLLFASIPLAVLCIFGSQADIMRLYLSLIPRFLVPRFISKWFEAKADAHVLGSALVPNPPEPPVTMDEWSSNLHSLGPRLPPPTAGPSQTQVPAGLYSPSTALDRSESTSRREERMRWRELEYEMMSRGMKSLRGSTDSGWSAVPLRKDYV